jgi:23S rRNA pseudouridine1911/1915/1917 synthase
MGFPQAKLFPAFSLVEINLETGRTHQIRLHFSNMNHPLVGDLKYNSDRSIGAQLNLSHQWLHSKRLEINHPLTGKRMLFDADYPYDLKNSLRLIQDNIQN